ncbi:hypothetical protein PC129_g24676 [Phytophthora cactorum]|uniref:Uncharacterized protein n=1 Tax=Phytophthora cactorum TaxID=29920 RepID=A0A8T1AAG8_9STRA|nr:hypothetical protein PC114_g27597 [Phytophthora cactorum]KAG2875039.1 hypothetical protein PC117_g27486 [Phytophthora cactorum]KAG2957170.1 hypothetical protein PC119_g27416 [Phytophthora cactorum]KAG3119269.1 hypothetical protein C6341_g27426 [Phytophthora cactorum]KAG3196517.1 hypothetical protein PC129_g24676 [Phytophthora cactorum]
MEIASGYLLNLVLQTRTHVLLHVRLDLTLALCSERRIVHGEQHHLVVAARLRHESSVPTSSAVNSTNSWKPEKPVMYSYWLKSTLTRAVWQKSHHSGSIHVDFPPAQD